MTLAAQLQRYWRHFTMTPWQMRRAFGASTLQAITARVRASEQLHGGEIRVAIEADLSLAALWRGHTPRARAEQVFTQLGVWNTQQRNGVLLYLCLADHAVEIIADHGLQTRVAPREWQAICAQLEQACVLRQYGVGVVQAVLAIGQLLAREFPAADRNELADSPILL